MNKSTLGDSDILNGTIRETDDKGRQQLQFPLPGGPVVKSEFMAPDAIKGKVYLQWVAAVRDQHNALLSEKEAEELQKLKAKELRKSQEPTTTSEEPEPVSTQETLAPVQEPVDSWSMLPDDPNLMVERKIEALEDRLHKTKGIHQKQEDEIRSMEQALKGWKTIRDSFDAPPPAPKKKRGRPRKKVTTDE